MPKTSMYHDVIESWTSVKVQQKWMVNEIIATKQNILISC